MYELCVVGASWGGLRAVGALLDGLPERLELAFVVAQHRGTDSVPGGLEDLLRSRTRYPVEEADDKQPIESGHVYIAPPDYHLLVDGRSLALSVDERVNYARPSIDVLFESAADAYRERLIGIVLTGANHDGAAGLARIKQRGGVAIVQDPAEAEAPAMPAAALAATEADAVLPLAEIGRFLHGLCAPVGAPGSAGRARERDCAAAPRANILLVDDRHENLVALEAILEPLGHELVLAHSGDEALAALLRRDFAVILLDVQMPGIDGFATAELIKQRARTRHVPIIFLTAISKDEQHVFRGYSAGAVDYLFKPFNPDVLRSKVTVFVELWEKTELLREHEERLREEELAEATRQSEERYRRLAEAMPQIVWTAERGGRDHVRQRPLVRLHGPAARPRASPGSRPSTPPTCRR